jgi:hypothetical protein
MINVQLLQEYITLIKDIITIISTIVIGAVAIMGLRAWRIQLRGKTEYELARRLLRSVYKVRDAIKLVRNPFASAGEISSALRDANIEISFGDPDYRARSQGALYQSRWKHIQESLRDLDLEAFEAEVVWGREVIEIILPLRRQIGELYSHIEIYLKNLQEPSRREYALKMAQKIDEVIYDSHDLVGSDSKNSFTNKTVAAVKQIEDYIRPRLKL